MESSKNKRYMIKSKDALMSIVGILIIVILIMYIFEYFSLKNTVDSNTYQAVFLDNGQIYFGHLGKINSKFPVLSDTHYVQIDDTTSRGTLVKLGSVETHAPYDKMMLNKEHILFWENLRPDSPFMDSLKNL